jgi:hypothetical protein
MGGETTPVITDIPTELRDVIGTMDESEVRIGIEAKAGTELKVATESKAGIATLASAAEIVMSVGRTVKVRHALMQ